MTSVRCGSASPPKVAMIPYGTASAPASVRVPGPVNTARDRRDDGGRY